MIRSGYFSENEISELLDICRPIYRTREQPLFNGKYRGNYKYTCLGLYWNATTYKYVEGPHPIPQFLLELGNKHGIQCDTVLVNFYEPGDKLGLHQDNSEKDLTKPIVSISLGLSCIFQLGGYHRSNPVQNIRLNHNDLLVLEGEDRMRFHGVSRIIEGSHKIPIRINLTLRQAH
jgi:alkylated DNA repair dioxygenase AlkB